MSVTRRDFLAASAAVPALRAQPQHPAALKVQPFALQHVRLLDGPFRTCQQANLQFLHDLESDRLLHTFRLTAGLLTNAEPLGGWERPDVELRGHFLGHYLSACALMTAATGDDALRSKANAIVGELAKCQRAMHTGYLSAFPVEFFDRLKEGRKVWAPWYTLHKIMAGLLEMHQLAGNAQALEILDSMAGWAARWASAVTDEQMARIQTVEFGGMNEVLYNLYAVSGRKAHLELAHRFDHKALFDPLAEGRDELKGLHANTTVPKIIGAARRYELTGDARYRTIAENFWRQVAAYRCYATGGTSDREHWREAGKLAATLGNQNQECCVTYNMLKLTRHLFTWSAEPHYADYYERAMFNGILGTMNPEDGMTMYFVPLASGYWKLFSTPRNSFWCCTGTGVESFSKPAESIYFHNERELYVNLFIASRLDWPERGLRLRQDTKFPEQQGAALSFELKQPVRLALRLRIPDWAAHGIMVKVNGSAAAAVAGPSSFVTVERTWQSGDKVEIETPMHLHRDSMPDDDRLQALMYGPFVLAGDLGTEGLMREMRYGDMKGGHTCQGDPVPAPAFTDGPLTAWVKPDAKQPLVFRAAAQPKDVTLIPLHRVTAQRYAVYWRMNPVNTLTAEEKAAGWQLLFDGRSFAGWDDPTKKSPPGDSWLIQDGCLCPRPRPKLMEDLFTKETFRDFELTFEWRVAPGSNTGVKYRIQESVLLADGKFDRFEDSVEYSLRHRRTDRPAKGQEYVIGFEYQVIDNTGHKDARRGPKYQAGALYDLVGPVRDATRPVGEFNHSRLLLQGDHVEHWLNGVKVVDEDLMKAAKGSGARWGSDSEVYRILTTQAKKDCRISLQNHNDAAWFRNLKIRRL